MLVMHPPRQHAILASSAVTVSDSADWHSCLRWWVIVCGVGCDLTEYRLVVCFTMLLPLQAVGAIQETTTRSCTAPAASTHWHSCSMIPKCTPETSVPFALHLSARQRTAEVTLQRCSTSLPLNTAAPAHRLWHQGVGGVKSASAAFQLLLCLHSRGNVLNSAGLQP
jgi:hypothetical protein